MFWVRFFGGNPWDLGGRDHSVSFFMIVHLFINLTLFGLNVSHCHGYVGNVHVFVFRRKKQTGSMTISCVAGVAQWQKPVYI